MHETLIATNIINEAKKHGEVSELYLEIGELADIPPKDLIKTLKAMVEWKIHFTEKQAFTSCGCGFSGHPTILERTHNAFVIECPECKSVPIPKEGTDIKIQKIVVD